MNILFLIIGAAVGLLVGYLAADRKTVALKSQIAGKENELTLLRLQKEESERLYRQQKEEAEKLHEQMKQEFENLSNSILKKQTDEFKAQNAEHIGNLLRPLGDNLKEFREKVDKVYSDEARERFSLEKQIKVLVEQNSRLSEDANNLTRALKGNSKAQGNWGEMILERLLQASGLIEGEHYYRQELLKDEQGKPLFNEESGQRMQPDIIVRYPGDKEMIIDSKVSLTAYVGYTSTDDKNERDYYQKEHLNSVYAHVNELSEKDYSRYDLHAPDFVMMFIPNEGAYLLAMQSDPHLWEYAYQKKVVLMSPTNLISALRLSLDLWNKESQARNIQAIIDRATSLYEKIAGFTDTFLSIGDRLKGVQTAYDEATKQLSTGRGNVIRQAEQLRALRLTPKKQISPRLLSTDGAEEEDERQEDI